MKPKPSIKTTVIFLHLVSLILKIQKIILFIALLLMFSHSLKAFHIIGGEITYVCKGNNVYDFTLKMYRDCLGNGACFDSQPSCMTSALGHLTIFEGSRIFGTTVLDPPRVTDILPNVSNPCLILPPNICVEEGVYQFTLTLPPSAESYTIAYQRCCRNSTILNIVNPDRVGATYMTEIPPASQQACNSSPVFKNFPPIVICKGEDINFDHSATDIDGDELEYSFCTPFVGGGFNTINPTSVIGVTPDPESPPPYTPVTYISPYSVGNPLNNGTLPGQPRMSINKKTGLITGIPNILGQFVVGVCVKAYSNGVLVNEVRRDFQFNVANCQPRVFSDVKETELLMRDNEPLYYIKLCGDEEIINESTIRSNIQTLQWNFQVPNGTISSTQWDPFDLEFPGPGLYEGELLLNPGLTCNHEAKILVEVFPDLEANFSFDYDTCEVGPVVFQDQSTADAGFNAIIKWNWDFGNGDSSRLVNPIYQYDEAKNYPVTLQITDINNCVSTVEKRVSYLPLPPLLAVAPSTFKGCLPADIFFENLSHPINNDYEIMWDFGDGTVVEGLNPVHRYETEGVFDISLLVVSPFGCLIDTTWPELITTVPSPVAFFTFSPHQPSNFHPLVQFTDESIDANRWEWNFNDQGRSFDPNPSFSFKENGTKFIDLTVWHPNGCIDTTRAFLEVIPEIRYKLPNAFTPNGDGINDLFFGKGNPEDASYFIMSIWNRYGEKLFETTDPKIGWNGRKNNTGKHLINGVYIVLVEYENPITKEVIQQEGFVTLLK